MSKILINSESVLKTILGALDFCKRSCVENAEFSDAEKYIKNAIENSKRFSVLEWHPMSEKPEKGRIILVRHKDNSVPFDVYKVGAFELDSIDYPYINVKEWAYLPE